ncbi:dynein axonemal heavy chain 8 [Carassius carassius]|uniref:dynein axonemal heavy chain 8 n=1 Tax=Carassius carassius TaxID=217509 RepID=UPI0028688E7C|nr:dynein axonemal heavy chain 8 [Carassius carassius]
MPHWRHLFYAVAFLHTTVQVFGIHSNAEIIFQRNMANETMSTILNIQPNDSSCREGEIRELSVHRTANEMLEKLTADYVPHEVMSHTQKWECSSP